MPIHYSLKKYSYLIVSAFLIVLTTTSGFAVLTQQKACTPVSKEHVISLFNQWSNAVKIKDLDAVVAAYADNAVLLPTLSNTPRINHKEIRAYFLEFFKKNPAATINTRVIKTGCDWASDTGLYTFQLNHDGKIEPTQARYSYVYELMNGKWLIISHHSSLMPEKDEEAEGDL